jgi:hypothetical protein
MNPELKVICFSLQIDAVDMSKGILSLINNLVLMSYSSKDTLSPSKNGVESEVISLRPIGCVSNLQ